MWPGGGMTMNHCPCCKVCENCPGFQKVLDVRDAGFVLYRHTTLVQDIDKKTGASQIITNTLDDVFILENTQDVPLENVDFTTELDRNQISCPRCVNIIKHAQRLLQNQELGASDLIGVCRHCRQKSQAEKTCLKCNEIVQKFQLSKAAGKKISRAQKVKTWLSKIQMLIQKAFVEDKDKKQDSQLRRRYSDIDINRILRKISETDREPEIADLFLPDIDSSKIGPLSDRSYYRGVKKNKDVIFHETGTCYGDRRHHSTPYEEVSRVSFPVPEKGYDDSLLQSNTTLTEAEFVRKYGKSNNIQIEDNKVYDYINQKQFLSEEDTFQNRRTKKESVAIGNKYYESDRKRNLMEKSDFGYEDSRNIESIPTVSKHYERGRKKDLLEEDTFPSHIRGEEYIPMDRKRDLGKDDTISDEKRREYVPSTKHYDSDEKKDLPKSDFEFDSIRRRESVTATSKYYDSDRKKDWPKADIVSDHRKEREFDETTSKYYGDERKDLPRTELVSDDRRRKEFVTTASKYYDSDKKRDTLKADAVSDNRIKKEAVPVTIKYDISDRKQEATKADSVSDERRRRESVATASKYYDSDKKRDTLKADAVSDDRIKKEAIPMTSKYDISDRKQEATKVDLVSDERRRRVSVATASKYYDSDKKRDTLKADAVSDDRIKKEAIPMTSKYDISDRKQEAMKVDLVSDERRRRESVATARKRDILKSDTVSDDRIKKEAIPMTTKYDISDRKQEDPKAYSVSDERRRMDSVTKTSKYYDSDKKKDILKTDAVSDDKIKKEAIPMTSKYGNSDRKKEVPKADAVSNERRRMESVAMASKYYDSDKKRDILKADTVSDDKIKKEAVPMTSEYDTSGKKKEALKADSVSDDRKRRLSAGTPSKYSDSDKNRDIPKDDRVYNDRKRRESVSTTSEYYDKDRKKEVPAVDQYYESDKKRKLFGADNDPSARRGKEYASVDDADNDPSARRRKEYAAADDENYEAEKRKHGNRHGEETKGFSPESAIDERPKHFTSVGKDYEGERTQGFITRIGKGFEEKYKHDFGEKFSTTNKDLENKLAKIFVPLAVRRYTQDVSALLQPILGGLRDKKSIEKKSPKTGKTVYESPSRVRKYRSDESLLTGITKLKGTTSELVGFDFFFPQVEGLAKKKLRKARSVSSSELIKDTIDKLKLKAEDEKRKREEAERLKEERRKQIEAEKKERELAKKIAKDLEKQVKEREKEMELELKAQAAKQKEEDQVNEFLKEKNVMVSNELKQKDRQIDIAKDDDVSVTKKPKSTSGKEAAIVKKEKAVQSKTNIDAKAKVKEDEGKIKAEKEIVKLETGKVTEEKGKVKEAGKIEEEKEKAKEEKGKIKDETGKIKEESGKVKEETGKVKEETGKVKEEKRKVEEEKGKVKEETGKHKEETGKVKEETGKVKEAGKMKEEKGKVEEAGKIKEEKGKVEEEKGKVKEEKGKVKEQIGKAKEETGKIKELTGNDKEEKGKELKTADNKTKGIETKQKKIKEEKAKSDKSTKEAIGDKEKKMKDDTLDKEKNKHESEAPDKNKQAEQAERERLKKELKQQKEAEKTGDDKAAEIIKQSKGGKKGKEKMKEIVKTEGLDHDVPSGKKRKESVKTEDVSDHDTKQKKTVEPAKKAEVVVPATAIKIQKKLSIYDLVVPKDRPKERQKIMEVVKPMLEIRKRRVLEPEPSICASDLELDLESLLRKKQDDMKKNVKEVVIGGNIHKFVSHVSKTKDKEENIRELYRAKVEEIREMSQRDKKKKEENVELQPINFKKEYDQNFVSKSDIAEVEPKPELKPVPMPEPNLEPKPEPERKSKPTKGDKEIVSMFDPDYGKGVVRYALSDRSFIEKGWTMLPTEKVVRKMNVYRMRPSHPEFDWFERNKKKGLLEYDTGEKLAQFDDNGRGRLYYKSGNLALDYYNAEEVNAQQRFVIYSSGEPDERGRTQPRTVLATFDYLGNGIVFDHAGKIRLKYNQTEGVILDRSLGPVSHWKWHTLNDPPVLQQVMIDTQMAHKDPNIYKLGAPGENKPRPDDEQMLAIEFDNFIKEKSAKLTQTFKPFQIKMKALKINEYFSLRVLDQATVYLIYRDGSKIVKLNIGMILDHKEIVDTDTAEVGEVSSNVERLPARTDSLAELQRSVANAQKIERSRSERDRRIRRPEAVASADRLAAAASRPLQPPLRTVDSASTLAPNKMYCKCRKPTSCNVYYDTSLI